MNVPSDVSRLLIRDLEGCRRELRLFPDDERVWSVVPGITNSAGNLALHVAGNLRHFVGACLGGSGYRRDRSAEFATRAGSRDWLDRELADTIDAVRSALRLLPASALDAPMPGAPNQMVARTGMFLLHLVAHTAFHLGQIGYLRRVLTGEAAVSAGPLPMEALVDGDASGNGPSSPPAIAPMM
ncbi:MAG TPA: DUF664 domain-containing protein [Vicinamibacterales bacterium]|nr:DUF664 domain-containing protein [Vicinamibacterales bacterium]